MTETPILKFPGEALGVPISTNQIRVPLVTRRGRIDVRPLRRDLPLTGEHPKAERARVRPRARGLPAMTDARQITVIIRRSA